MFSILFNNYNSFNGDFLYRCFQSCRPKIGWIWEMLRIIINWLHNILLQVLTTRYLQICNLPTLSVLVPNSNTALTGIEPWPLDHCVTFLHRIGLGQPIHRWKQRFSFNWCIVWCFMPLSRYFQLYPGVSYWSIYPDTSQSFFMLTLQPRLW